VEAKSVGAIINTLVITGYALVAGFRGFARRRAYWSRGSWLGLGVTLLVSFALVGFGLGFSLAVDNHAAWVGVSRSRTRAAWVAIAMGCLVAGSLLGGVSMAWFALGDPSRPFPFFGRAGSAVDAEQPRKSDALSA
jgi:hypothetical protein